MGAASTAAGFPSIDQMAETENRPQNAETIEELEEEEAALLAEQEKVPYTLPNTYDNKTQKLIRKFFKNRRVNHKGFRYDNNGNLESVEGAKGFKGSVARGGPPLRLKRFVPIDSEERAALEEMRKDTLAAVDEEYERARTLLNEAWQQYSKDGAMQPVFRANQMVAALDSRRSEVRAAVRNIASIPNMSANKILFDEPFEDRKLIWWKDDFKVEIARLELYPFKQEYEFGKYMDDELLPEQAAAESKDGAPSLMDYQQKLKDGRIARIFYDSSHEVNGFLSPMNTVRFTYGNTEYSSAYQAYQVERAREVLTDGPDKTTIINGLLGASSSRTMRLFALRMKRKNPVNARALWLGILTALYQQTHALKTKLVETGTDALVYADPAEEPSGVGLSEDHSGILNPANWKQENIVGRVLEAIRTQIREEALQEAPANENVEQAAITEEQQEKARVGAIINNMRGGRGRGR